MQPSIRLAVVLAAVAALAACLLHPVGEAPAQDDPRAEIEADLREVELEMAEDHADLGKWLARKDAHAWAYGEYRLALVLDPDNRDARKALGWEKEDDRWVRDPDAEVERRNDLPSKDAEIDVEVAWNEKADRNAGKRADDLMDVAEDAEEAGFTDWATRIRRRALAQDPWNPEILRAMGFASMDWGWAVADFKDRYEAVGEPGPPDEPSPYADKIGGDWSRVQTERFRAEGTVGEGDLKHAARAAEATLALMQRWTGRDEDANPFDRRVDVIALSTQEEHHRYIDEVSGLTGNRATFAKKMGGQHTYRPPRMECWGRSGETLADMVVHDTTHLYLHLVIGQGRHAHKPWLYEGFAYRWTGDHLASTHTWCAEQAGTGGGSRGWSDHRNWPRLLKRMVAVGSDEPMTSLSGKDLSSLGTRSTAKAWSILEFLEATDRDKLQQFLAGGGTAEALQRAFGWDWAGLDEEWRAWVIRAY